MVHPLGIGLVDHSKGGSLIGRRANPPYQDTGDTTDRDTVTGHPDQWKTVTGSINGNVIGNLPTHGVGENR